MSTAAETAPAPATAAVPTPASVPAPAPATTTTTTTTTTTAAAVAPATAAAAAPAGEKAEGQTTAAAGANPHQPVSLYVGGLDTTVTEAMLFELFSSVGLVASIRVCRDAVSRRSLGYAYVNYNTHSAANDALNDLNYTTIKGKPCRIMWSNRDPSQRRIGKGNIFIKNLDTAIDDKALHDTFAAFGEILSSKVAIDQEGNSLGYGFVHFRETEAADKAINSVNGMLLNDKKVFVAHHIPKKDRQSKSDDPDNTFTNLHIKNLDPDMSQDELIELFSRFGKITSASISKKVIEINGVKNTFGFINFEAHESARMARDEMQNSIIRDRELEVNRAMKQEERKEILRRQQPQKVLSPSDSRALYVKQLPRHYTEEDVRKLFAPCGTVEKCTLQFIHVNRQRDSPETPTTADIPADSPVAETADENATQAAVEKPATKEAEKDKENADKPEESTKSSETAAEEADAKSEDVKPKKESSGVAYVFMADAKQAADAIAKLNKKMVDSMPLYVAQLLPRETRRAIMAEVHRSQFHPGSMNPGRFPNRPIPGAPPMVSSGFHGPYGGRAPMPNHFVPVYPMHQQWQNPAQYQLYNGRGPAPTGMPYPPKLQQMQQNIQMGAGDVNPPIPIPERQIPQEQAPSEPSDEQSAQALTEEKRSMGERLYPKVFKLYPKYSGKLTGMLLEASMKDLERIDTNADALREKVDEAYDVYMQHLRSHPGENDQPLAAN